MFKSVKIRLGAPNYPGDTMTMTGQVTKKEDGLVEVALRGSNRLGDHVTGTVTLELPDPPVRWSSGEAPKGAKPSKADRKRAKAEKKRKKKGKK